MQLEQIRSGQRLKTHDENTALFVLSKFRMLRIRKSLTTEQSQYSMRTVQREIVSQYET